jgi:hypothetical protein
MTNREKAIAYLAALKAIRAYALRLRHRSISEPIPFDAYHASRQAGGTLLELLDMIPGLDWTDPAQK